MDSGCTFHMCPVKEWFQNLRDCKRGLVFLGDNRSCEILGIGEIKIRMFDGIVRTLGDVRFIPELRKNLISPGQLDNLGLTYKAKGDILKVTKGSIVVIKAERKN